MTQKYDFLEKQRDKLCAKRREVQAQLNILDDLIHEIHSEMEKELDKEFKDLEDIQEPKDCCIEGEK